MGVKKRRIPATEARVLAEPNDVGDDVLDALDEDGGFEEVGFDDDVEVLEVDLSGAQFTVDTMVARLASEGVDVVRSSPFSTNLELGSLGRFNQHKLIFRAEDRDAVGQALRDAGLL